MRRKASSRYGAQEPAHAERDSDLVLADRPSAATMTALQGRAGNDAVARWRQQSGPVGAATPVQRALDPAPDRLGHYLDAMEKPGGERGASRAKRSRALTELGRAIPEQLVEMEEQTADYKPNATDSVGGEPEAGGRFQNLYGRDEHGSVAVMMENYRSKQEKYTASEAFVHQWSRASALFDGGEGIKPKPATKELGARTDPGQVPDRLPDSVYRQNISGPQAKETLNSLLPEGQSELTFTEQDQKTYEAVMRTVNGKSTLNIVRTFNELHGLKGKSAHRITGGRVKRDGDGNFQLRFDITRG
ncbi:hypothetical protein [Streptomyces sp. AC602_WCS936]|uniref:hypothetical protein n=1 Tax=Streptomyces sp. AC602_WCS936 TaxID=2823685 RepID=UPI001C261477|nr:hypothetical protein [Streptomyces sp. AC602_WCS936]